MTHPSGHEDFSLLTLDLTLQAGFVRGNFDIILSLFFLAHFSAPPHPARDVAYALYLVPMLAGC